MDTHRPAERVHGDTKRVLYIRQNRIPNLIRDTQRALAQRLTDLHGHAITVRFCKRHGVYYAHATK